MNLKNEKNISIARKISYRVSIIKYLFAGAYFERLQYSAWNDRVRNEWNKKTWNFIKFWKKEIPICGRKRKNSYHN